MSLKDRLEDTPARKPTGFPCSVGALLESLDDVEAAALTDMLYTLGWSGAQIWEALDAEGYQVGKQSVNRHRGKACRCFGVHDSR